MLRLEPRNKHRDDSFQLSIQYMDSVTAGSRASDSS
jgi:hypothetical protein